MKNKYHLRTNSNELRYITTSMLNFEKMLLCFSILFLCVSSSFAQIIPTTSRAAIVHSKFRSADSGGMASDANAVTTIQYFDGLRNPLQTVGYRQSPTKKDIVLKATTYDNQLRPFRTYLPYATSANSGGYQPNLQTSASSFYGDAVPYEEIIRYDNSPLNRIREKRGAGAAWKTNNKTQKEGIPTSYQVKRLSVNAAGDLVYNSGSYGVFALEREFTEDESGNVKVKITDLDKKTVSVIEGDNLSTTYVYDNRDRLYAVIQPQGYDFGSVGITKDSEHWQRYVFAYEYDLRNRIIRKHIPGAGWTEIVYDKADRPVMTQDAVQKTQNRWNFIQYDVFGREIAFGETAKATTRAAAQSLFNSHTVLHETWNDYSGYSEVSFPATLRPAPVEIERFNFYDTYGFIASEFAYKPAGAFHTPKSSAKGLLTGVSKRNSRDDNRYYTDTYYYDDLNRIIQSQHTHQLSTGNQQNVIVSNKEYNFSNEVTKEHTTYPLTTGTVSTAQYNFYDHIGRIIQIDYGISTSAFSSAQPAIGGRTTEAKGGMYSLGFSQPENGVLQSGTSGFSGSFTLPTLTKLVMYSYDEIGRMSEKRFMPDGTYSLGNPDYVYLPPSPSSTVENKARKAVILEAGTLIEAATTGSYLAAIDSTVSDIPPFSSLQRQRYNWHIRGGLQGINLNPTGNPIPDMTKGDLFAYKLEYEAAGQWNGNIGRQSWNHIQGTEQVGVRNYLFTYDGLSRLKTATFSGLAGENYSIPNINYDKNGNITQLLRNGKKGSLYGEIDLLSYSYSGNRLTSVSDLVSGDHETDFVPKGAGSYTYWQNGTLKSDANEQITNITYNTFLNQPEQITLNDGRWIKHTYDGFGMLIKTEYSTGEYWEFTSGMVFKNGAFYQIAIPEGRAIYEGGAWKLEFDYKDHTGNTRVTFKADGNRLVHTAKTDTDPFGVILKTGQENSFQNRFEMQGHEREKTFGLNRVNFGARIYNPTIARFLSIDPRASEREWLTPYNYVQNNPVNRIDPDGALDDPIYDKKGNLIGDDGQSNNKAYVVSGNVAKDVKRATKAGEFYTGSLAENNNVMKVPTGGVMKDVINSVDATVTSEREHGGHANFGDANATRWDEGSAAVAFTDKDGNPGARASLTMFKIDGKNKIPTDASNVEFWWHTHPKTSVNGLKMGSSTPSPADFKGQTTMVNKGFKGNTFVIGTRSGTVTFYNDKKALTTIKYSTFKKIGGQ